MTFDPKKFTPARELLALADLKTDGRFNRPINEAWVDRIISQFNGSAFGTIVVAANSDRTYTILDGQHRVAALRALGLDPARSCIPATVHRGLSSSDRAYLFTLLNNTKRITPYDKFRALLTAGDPDTKQMNAIVEKAGLRVGADGQEGVVQGVSAIQRIYGLSQPKGKVLAETLDVIVAAWGAYKDALRSQILEGISRYLHEHPEADIDNVVYRLAKLPGGPSGLLGRARVVRGPTPQLTLPDAIAQVIERDVMKKKRRNMKAVAS